MKIVDYTTYLLFRKSNASSSRLHESTSRLHVSTSRLHQPAGSAIKVYPIPLLNLMSTCLEQITKNV